jgi:orotate phosphoribosyltransferase
VDGEFTLRRGFALEPGERVAVVEDVVTTGKSTREVLAVVRDSFAVAVVCGAIVDRRSFAAGRGADLDGVPYRALLALDVPAFDPAACPRCAAGDPVVAPGSRHLAAKTPLVVSRPGEA